LTPKSFLKQMHLGTLVSFPHVSRIYVGIGEVRETRGYP